MCSFSYWVRTSTVPMRSIVWRDGGSLTIPGCRHPGMFGPPSLRGDQVVQGVALVGLAAGAGDQAANRRRGHDLRGVRPGHVVDALFLHGAVEVVGAEPQRRLGDADAGRDPERLDVRDVVEHQA